MPLFLLICSLVLSLMVVTGMGYAALRLIGSPIDSSDVRLPIAATLGLTLVCILTAFVGLTFGWDPALWGLLGFFVAMAAFGVASAWRDGRTVAGDIRRWWNDAHAIERALVVAGCSALFGYIAQAALPPTEADSIRSYLRDAQLLIVDGRLHALPDEVLTCFPMNRQMLSVIGYFLWGYPLARLFGFTIAWITVVCLAVLTRRLFDVRPAMLSIPLLIFVTEFRWMASSGKVDLLVTLFLVAAILVIELVSSQRSWGILLFLAGVFFGGALGTKPTAALYLPLLGAWVVKAIIAAPPEVRPSPGRLAGAFGLAAIGGIVGYAPWMVWGWTEFNSPLYPFITASGASISAESTHYGGPWDRLWLAVRSPYLLTSWSLFEASSSIPVVLWILAGVGLVAYRRRPAVWWIGGGAIGVFFTFAYFTFMSRWFMSLRFMFVGVVLLAGLAGIGLAAIMQGRRRWVRWGIGGVAALVVLVSVLRPVVIGYTSVRVVLGIDSPDVYIAKYIGPHEPILWAREHWTWEDKVWSVDVTDLIYFNARVYYSYVSDIGRRLSQSLSTAEERCACMDSAGIGYVLVGPKTHTGLMEPLAAACLDTVFVSSDSAYVVYRRRGISQKPPNHDL